MLAAVAFVGVAFGVLGAVAVGVGDFLGGVASRRSTAWGVTTVAWLGQAPMMVALAYLLKGGLDAAAIGPGLVAGVAGAVGGVFLYGGIARGDVAIVAATSGVLASSGAALYDAVSGVALPAVTWAGIALAVPAIVLVAGGGVEIGKVSLRGLGAGLGAGGSFALFYVLIGVTGGENGDPTVVAVVAATAGLLLLVTAPLRPGPVMPRGSALGISLAAAALSGLHLGALLFAVKYGSVATGTVLVSQYPAFTVLMAALVWGQRPTRLQVVGLLLALLAVGMIASATP
ncbi:MAG: DMT family transporter [bacterium]|nr:DMT family transporter [bacterium]MDE0287940.1 DMT family transporter [bacterium]MDE0439681.1 DMT family transporter [bacterium]